MSHGRSLDQGRSTFQHPPIQECTDASRIVRIIEASTHHRRKDESLKHRMVQSASVLIRHGGHAGSWMEVTVRLWAAGRHPREAKTTGKPRVHGTRSLLTDSANLSFTLLRSLVQGLFNRISRKVNQCRLRLI